LNDDALIYHDLKVKINRDKYAKSLMRGQGDKNYSKRAKAMLYEKIRNFKKFR
jgi:hypothetical protein